jgi:hypothetical protein
MRLLASRSEMAATDIDLHQAQRGFVYTACKEGMTMWVALYHYPFRGDGEGPLTSFASLRQNKAISTANMFSLCAYETADHLIQRKRFFDPAQKVGLTTYVTSGDRLDQAAGLSPSTQ